jgi:hypothetical protein
MIGQLRMTNKEGYFKLNPYTMGLLDRLTPGLTVEWYTTVTRCQMDISHDMWTIKYKQYMHLPGWTK